MYRGENNRTRSPLLGSPSYKVPKAALLKQSLHCLHCDVHYGWLILIVSHGLFQSFLGGSRIAPGCSYAVVSAHSGPFAAFWCSIH